MLRFIAYRALAFSPKLEAALWPFLVHFKQHVRNQKYYTPVGGGSKSRHGTHSNWKRKCNNMAVKTDRSSCGIARFPCSSTAFLFCIVIKSSNHDENKMWCNKIWQNTYQHHQLDGKVDSLTAISDSYSSMLQASISATTFTNTTRLSGRKSFQLASYAMHFNFIYTWIIPIKSKSLHENTKIIIKAILL